MCERQTLSNFPAPPVQYGSLGTVLGGAIGEPVWQLPKPRRLPHWLRHRWGKWMEHGRDWNVEYQRRECEVCGRSQVRAS